MCFLVKWEVYALKDVRYKQVFSLKRSQLTHEILTTKKYSDQRRRDDTMIRDPQNLAHFLEFNVILKDLITFVYQRVSSINLSVKT